MKPRLIVHSDVWSIPDEQDGAHVQGVKRSMQEVYPLIQRGISDN
ncbi:MAG: hypothetical protein RAP70_01875 [Candidatus Celaenobacter antarcticus]|nr:hypothetical protein [Candidatus Celaenobacter antarcticus]MDP8313803.1 hypothetical protein [Candidatus Celaenobacter antarcticus]